MIRTDGKPTIAWRPLPEPITDGSDPGDEHQEPREKKIVFDSWDEIEAAQPTYGGF